MNELTHNRRPDFGVWLEIRYAAWKDTRIKSLYEKYLTPDNYLMYNDDVFTIPQNALIKPTLEQVVKQHLCNAEYMGGAKCTWDERDIAKLLYLRTEWVEHWQLYMACPYAPATNCKGMGCIAWCLDTDCCARLEADTLALDN